MAQHPQGQWHWVGDFWMCNCVSPPCFLGSKTVKMQFLFSQEEFSFMYIQICDGVASKNSQLHFVFIFASNLPGIFFGGGRETFWGLGVGQYCFCTCFGRVFWTIWCKQYNFFVSMATSQTRFVSRTCLFFNIFYHFRGWFIFTFSVQSHHVPQCFEEIKNGILHWKSLSK